MTELYEVLIGALALAVVAFALAGAATTEARAWPLLAVLLAAGISRLAEEE